MTFDEYKTASYWQHNNPDPLMDKTIWAIGVLQARRAKCSKNGRRLSHIKKVKFDDDLERFKKELGDVVWYIASARR